MDQGEAKVKHDLLLLSNSAVHGRAYLAHALDAIAEFLGGRKTLYFIPFALKDYTGYTAIVQEALRPLGVQIIGLHTFPDPRAALEQAQVVFVGGGNTWRLVKKVQELGLCEPVQRRVLAGELSYLGSSAGTNLACPTIRTTNDMPIVQPPSEKAFGLVPFQINPHYVDADPSSTHMGETREKRIHEFHEENDVAVLGLREGAWLRRQDTHLTLGGTTRARLFQRGMPETEYQTGAELEFLLRLPANFDV